MQKMHGAHCNLLSTDHLSCQIAPPPPLALDSVSLQNLIVGVTHPLCPPPPPTTTPTPLRFNIINIAQ